MATINHKTYNEGTETFKDFSVYDGKDTLIFNVDGSAQSAAVTGTLAVSGNATFDTNTLVVDSANDRVGIGTSAPASALEVKGANATLRLTPASQNQSQAIELGVLNSSVNAYAKIDVTNTLTYDSNIRFFTNTNSSTTQVERMRIAYDGNVGIGTNDPAVKLDVAGRVNAAGSDYHSFSVDQGSAQIRLERTGTSTGVNYIGSDNRGLLITDSAFSTLAIFTANGLTFNGDTLAANALDDYEEGTFTPSVAFGGGSTGITYFDQVGNYTKIGRQVFITLYVALTNAGSSTGTATITGLPFTNGNVNRGNQAVGSIRFDNITYTGTLQVFVPNSTTYISFQQVTEAGTDTLLTEANFNGASEISVSVSYFV